MKDKQDLKDNIRNAAEKVVDVLSVGLSQTTYTNAFIAEIIKRGLKYRFSNKINILYEGVRVGEEEIQLVIDDRIAVEIKSVKTMSVVKDTMEKLKFLSKIAGYEDYTVINFVPVSEGNNAGVQIRMN